MGEENYDDLRKRNIAERNAVFAEFFTDLKKQTNEAKSIEEKYRDTENLENEPPRKRRRTHTSSTDDESVTFKRSHPVRKRYNTRSRSKNLGNDDSNTLDDEEDEEDEENKPRGKRRRLRVLFPWAKPHQRSIDLMNVMRDEEEWDEDEYDDDDSFEELERRKSFKVTKSVYDPNSIPSVKEITQDMIDNVAEKSTTKQYCKIRGSSCHQCRQKTMDTKTVCRSGECIGVRGQFCGPCLKGRYGETAVDALKDPNWACPPCRGLCNCSICRTRSGRRPTGILAPVAQEEGYSSVMDYLQSTELDHT